MNIAVVGTGYVGLVSGTCFAELGANVICVDVDVEKIENLNRGNIPIYEPNIESMVLRNIKADVYKRQDHDVSYLLHPGFKGFEAFGEIACRSIGHADGVRISRFIECQYVFFAFGDDQSGDGCFGYFQGVDAVDVIRRTGCCWRVLAPEFGVSGGFFHASCFSFICGFDG